MTGHEFAQPDKGEKFAPRDNPQWIGKLFLIWPERVESVTFDDGPTDVVTADVAIVDLIDPQTGAPKVMAGARISGKAMVPQLRRQVGGTVLGRLRQLPAQGQKSGAYVLDEFTEQDAREASAYLQRFPRRQFEQPAGQAPPAQQQAAPPPQGAAQGGPNPDVVRAFLTARGFDDATLGAMSFDAAVNVARSLGFTS